MNKTNYTSALFTHWMNLVSLAGIGISGLAFGWEAFGLGLLLEGMALYVLPSMPGVQQSLTASGRAARIERQRWYYLKSLWKIDKPGIDSPLDLFVKGAVNWADVASNYRAYGDYSDQVSAFSRLTKLVAEMRELQGVRPEAISDDQILRLDEMINGWLSILSMVQNTKESLRQLAPQSLASEFNKLQKAQAASNKDDKTAQIVMGERLRAIKSKVDSIPKMEQRIALAGSQADGIAQHIESICTQVRTSGASEAGTLLDSALMMDTSSFDNGVDDVVMAAEVRGSMNGVDATDQAVWDDIGAKLNTPALGYEDPKTIDYGFTTPKTRSRVN